MPARCSATDSARLGIVGCALLAFGLAPPPASAQAIDTLALRAHTRFLADDLLAGRGAGTPGERVAAAYIASELIRLGLEPVGDEFLHPVPLRRVSLLPETRLIVRVADADSAVFQHDTDFVLAAGGRDAFRDFRGEAIFLGNAEHLATSAPADSTVRGRVLVVIGTLGAAAATLIPRWRDAGAAAILTGVPDAAQLAAIARSRGPDRFFVDEVHDPIWQPELPVVLVGPAVLRALLGGARLPPGALEAGPIAPTPLGRTVRGHVAATVEDAPTTNVAGYIPGSDAALRDEFIAFTAHYDHLGIGAPDAGGDSIYNGFSDNAAGVAMLLAIAETMRAAPPDRSVLFLFFAAEERGLLGSTYYTTRPLVPLERTAAVINLDAGAPPAPPVSWRIAGDSIGLGPLARDVAASHGWTATLSAASPNTDYWPFLTRGVPAIFIVPGNEWEGVSAEGREALRERWDHYHQPSDEWSAEFPFRGVARYADFALEVGRAAAQRSFAPPPIRK